MQKIKSSLRSSYPLSNYQESWGGDIFFWNIWNFWKKNLEKHDFPYIFWIFVFIHKISQNRFYFGQIGYFGYGHGFKICARAHARSGTGLRAQFLMPNARRVFRAFRVFGQTGNSIPGLGSTQKTMCVMWCVRCRCKVHYMHLFSCMLNVYG